MTFIWLRHNKSYRDVGRLFTISTFRTARQSFTIHLLLHQQLNCSPSAVVLIGAPRANRQRVKSDLQSKRSNVGCFAASRHCCSAIRTQISLCRSRLGSDANYSNVYLPTEDIELGLLAALLLFITNYITISCPQQTLLEELHRRTKFPLPQHSFNKTTIVNLDELGVARGTACSRWQLKKSYTESRQDGDFGGQKCS